MPEIPTHITVQLDLEQQGIVEAFESAIRDAFYQGHVMGAQAVWRADGRPTTREDRQELHTREDYEDWRGWGPGAALPGGNRFRAGIEDAERMRKMQLDAPLITEEEWMDRVDRRMAEAARRSAAVDLLGSLTPREAEALVKGDTVIGDRAVRCDHTYITRKGDIFCVHCGDEFHD